MLAGLRLRSSFDLRLAGVSGRRYRNNPHPSHPNAWLYLLVNVLPSIPSCLSLYMTVVTVLYNDLIRVMNMAAATEVQNLLRFLSQDAKVPLSAALSKVALLRKANLNR